VLLLDRADQVGLGAEVVADGGVVALPGGFADLPIRHREHPVFGVQPLGRLENRLLGTAGPIGAGNSRSGHIHSEAGHSL
jgi:hypothetical protein